MVSLAAELEAAPGDFPRQYERFCIEIAARLSRSRGPRCVIVDGFDRLDETTKAVVHEFFMQFADATKRPQLWVVFEDGSTPEFSERAQVFRSEYGFHWTSQYELQTLSDAERLELATRLGDPSQAAFQTVKAIATGGMANHVRIRTKFEDLRHAHPSDLGPGPLELFYLLSLTAMTGGNPALPNSWLLSNLSEVGARRSVVLRDFFGGMQPSLSDLRGLFAEVEQIAPSDFLEIRHVAFEPHYIVNPECGVVLARHWHEFQLPSPAFGHLFWALYWHDKIQNKPREAFWINKLSVHLLAGLSGMGRNVPSLTDVTIKRAVVEATLFAAAACLTTCVLDHIPALIENCSRLVEGGADTDDEWRSEVNRLLALAWQSYSVLGADRLLAVIFRLQQVKSGATQNGSADPLEAIFLQSMDIPNVDPMARDVVLKIMRTQASPSVHDYARTRAMWLVLTTMDDPFITPLLLRGYVAGAEQLLAVVDGAFQRLESRSGQERLAIDFMTASLAIWCMMIVVTGSTGFRLGGDSPLNVSVLSARLEHLFLLALTIEEESTLEGTGGFDFVQRCFARELLITAAASALQLAERAASLELEDTEHESAERVLSEALAALGTDEAGHRNDVTGAQHEADRRCVEREMDLVMLTWRSLGLEQLAAFMNLRRAQLHVSGPHTGLDELALFRNTLAVLASEVERPDFLGVIANGVAARTARSSGDLVTVMLQKAAWLALRGAFGEQLLANLALNSLHTSRATPTFSEVARYLLDEDDDGPRLKQPLEVMADVVLPGLALKLLSAVSAIGNSEMCVSLEALLLQRAEQITETKIKEEVIQRVRCSELERDLKSDPLLDPLQVVAKWKPNALHDIYARVIDLLLRAHPRSPALMKEAYELVARQEGFVKVSAYVHLARRLAIRGDDDERATAVEFLKRETPRWEDILDTEENIDAFRILSRFDSSNREHYMARLTYWETVRHERDLHQTLPALVGAGHYFLVFEHYFDVLEFWGLATELPRDEFYERLNLDPDGCRRRVLQWARTGAVVPRPFATQEGNRFLSSEFLLFGHWLSRPPNEADHALDAAREQFDRVAGENLDELYAFIASLENLPEPVRRIIERHRTRFTEYTLPE
jgi:hypothetical protein